MNGGFGNGNIIALIALAIVAAVLFGIFELVTRLV